VRVYEDLSTGVVKRALGFDLEQNHPNPFEVRSTITFSLPTEQDVLLEVYDLMGRKVQTLAQGFFGAGSHRVGIEAGQLESGHYTYRMQAGNAGAIRKMLIL